MTQHPSTAPRTPVPGTLPVLGTPTQGTPTAPPTPHFTEGSDVSDCGQWEVGPADHPIRRQAPVTLAKDMDVAPAPRRLPPVGAVLADHRPGLRRNDLTALHSALWVLALRGGTQTMTWRETCPDYRF